MIKNIKIISVIIISILLIFNIPIYSNAFDEILSAGRDFINEGNSGTSGTGITLTDKESKIKEISNTVSSILLTIALGATVISGVVMGINFAMQSVEDKAKIKESMLPWIVGIIVSFGAYGIWKLVMGIFYGFNL